MRDQRSSLEQNLSAAVLEGLPDATLLVRRDGVIVHANRRIEDLLGWPAAELVGRSVETLIPDDVRARHLGLRDGFFRAPRNRLMGSGLELNALHHNGDHIAVEISLSPLDRDGEDLVVAAIRDASEQRALRTALIEERNRAAAIVDGLPDGVLEFNLDTRRYVTANPRFCEMVGLASDEVLAVSGIPPWWGAEDIEDITGIRDRAIAGEVTHYEMRLRHVSGRVIPVMVTSTTLSRNGQRTLLGLFHDVTEERQVAAELEQARAAMAVFEDRDRIAGDLHDGVVQRLFAAGLRLQSVIGRSDRDERVTEVVAQIDDAIKEIRTTIFRLHSRVHLDGGLSDALRAIVGESSRLLGYRPTLELLGPVDSVPVDVAVEMIAVARESLSNVVKHARASATLLRVAVDDVQIRLSIEDNGVGFTHDVAAAGSGVKNMQERAQRLGGHATIGAGTPGGTAITWTVPRPTT